LKVISYRIVIWLDIFKDIIYNFCFIKIIDLSDNIFNSIRYLGIRVH